MPKMLEHEQYHCVTCDLRIYGPETMRAHKDDDIHKDSKGGDANRKNWSKHKRKRIFGTQWIGQRSITERLVSEDANGDNTRRAR